MRQALLASRRRLGGLVNFAAYNYFLINPVSITITRKDGKITDEIQAVRFTSAAGSSSSSSCSGSGHTSSSRSGSGHTSDAPVVTAGALSPFDSFPQFAYTRWTTTQYSDCCFVASRRVYKLIPASGPGVKGTSNFSGKSHSTASAARRPNTSATAPTPPTPKYSPSPTTRSSNKPKPRMTRQTTRPKPPRASVITAPML